MIDEKISDERLKFEAWARKRALDLALGKDAWGRQIYAHTHIQAMWDGWSAAWNTRAPLPSKEVTEAARALIDSKQDTYRARNNRRVGIQDDAGEKMWIVPFDEMFDLEAALAKPS